MTWVPGLPRTTLHFLFFGWDFPSGENNEKRYPVPMQEASQGLEVVSPHGPLPHPASRPVPPTAAPPPIYAGDGGQESIGPESGVAATLDRAPRASPGFESRGPTPEHGNFPVFNLPAAAAGSGAVDGIEEDQFTNGSPQVDAPLSEAKESKVAEPGVEDGTGGDQSGAGKQRLPTGSTMQEGLLFMLAEGMTDDDDDDDDGAARHSASEGDGLAVSPAIQRDAGREGVVEEGPAQGAVVAELETVAASANPDMDSAPPQPETSEDTDVTAPEAGFEGPGVEVSGPVDTKGSGPVEATVGRDTTRTGGWVPPKRTAGPPPPREGQSGDPSQGQLGGGPLDDVSPIPDSVPPSVPLVTGSVAWPEEALRQANSVPAKPSHPFPSAGASVGLEAAPPPDPVEQVSGTLPRASRRNISRTARPAPKEQSPEGLLLLRGHKKAIQKPERPRRSPTAAEAPGASHVGGSVEATQGADQVHVAGSDAGGDAAPLREADTAEERRQEIVGGAAAARRASGGSQRVSGARSGRGVEPRKGSSVQRSAGRRASTRGVGGSPAGVLPEDVEPGAAERLEEHKDGRPEGEQQMHGITPKRSGKRSTRSAVTIQEAAGFKEDQTHDRGTGPGEMKGPGEPGGHVGADSSDQAMPGIQSQGASPTTLGGVEAPFFARPGGGSGRGTPRTAGPTSVTPTLKQYSRKRKRAVPRDEAVAGTAGDVVVEQEATEDGQSTKTLKASALVGGADTPLSPPHPRGGKKGDLLVVSRAGIELLSTSTPGRRATRTAAGNLPSSPGGEGTNKDSEGPVLKAARRSGRAVARAEVDQNEGVGRRPSVGTRQKAHRAGFASLPEAKTEAGERRKSARGKRSVPARFISSPGAATQARPLSQTPSSLILHHIISRLHPRFEKFPPVRQWFKN